jgi:hypothetical protein
VAALSQLLPRMLPLLDLPRAVLRGRFMKAVARVEHNGVPVDRPALALLDEHWESLRLGMIELVDAAYGVYEGTHFRSERFAGWLARNGVPLPRRKSGELVLNDDVFGDMADSHPRLQPLRQLRQALGMLRLRAVVLGTQYGMGEQTLALRINRPVAYARDLLRAHRCTYRKFWEWSDAAVNLALFRGRPPPASNPSWPTCARSRPPGAGRRRATTTSPRSSSSPAGWSRTGEPQTTLWPTSKPATSNWTAGTSAANCPTPNWSTCLIEPARPPASAG